MILRYGFLERGPIEKYLPAAILRIFRPDGA
jgi:hypothetical protein